MEPNESHQQQQQNLSSHYYHQQQHHHHHHPSESPTNGIVPTNDASHSHVVYPHSVPSSAAVTAPLEPAKKKRGRPRKYGTPEQALAAKRMSAGASSSGGSGFSARDKKENTTSSYSGSSRKSQSPGNTGQTFTPHILNVAVGEDVAQKIMQFMQQSKSEICILSASGTISHASLRQPATSGGNITYEGQFVIISLSGSYVRTEAGGKSGGLSICLSSTDGQIIGGGVGGPLMAAGPVQVIVSTFQIDTRKAADNGVRIDASGNGNRLASPTVSSPMMGGGGGFRPSMEATGRNPGRGNDDHDQHMGGGRFMIHPPHQGMHMATPSRPSGWGGGGLDGRSIANYDLAGRIGHASPSTENGDYDD